jgi:hypothetical protein
MNSIFRRAAILLAWIAGPLAARSVSSTPPRQAGLKGGEARRPFAPSSGRKAEDLSRMVRYRRITGKAGGGRRQPVANRGKLVYWFRLEAFACDLVVRRISLHPYLSLCVPSSLV